MNLHEAQLQHVRRAVRGLCRRALYPPSKAYRDGLRARFLLRVTGYLARNPYKPGRAKFEAFKLGFTEGGLLEIPPFRAATGARSRP